MGSKPAANFSEPMLQFFRCGHLSEDRWLHDMATAFRDLAVHLATDLPKNPERTVALRKLLEAKDCALRALAYEGSDAK